MSGKRADLSGSRTVHVRTWGWLCGILVLETEDGTLTKLTAQKPKDRRLQARREQPPSRQWRSRNHQEKAEGLRKPADKTPEPNTRGRT